MATYEELYDLNNDSALKNKVAVACAIKADGIIAEATPSAERLQWAEEAFDNPQGKADDLFWALIAANKDATVVNIQTATDTQIQTDVDAAVDKFYP